MSTPTPTTPTPSINLRLTKQDAELCAIALCNVIAAINCDINNADETTGTEQTERNQAAPRWPRLMPFRKRWRHPAMRALQWCCKCP